jgi:hypothetical protein
VSSAKDQLEEAIAACRSAGEYFAANRSEIGEDLVMAERAKLVIRNLEPLLGKVYLKTELAQTATYPCQQSARRIAELLAEVTEQGRSFAAIRDDLAEEFEVLERNAEIVKSAAASRDTIII